MKTIYSKKINNWTCTGIIILIVIIDILSKDWILNHIKINETQDICLVLNFLNIHNYGAAFSLLSDQGEWKKWFLCIFSISTILIMIKMIRSLTYEDSDKKMSYSCIIAGAIGNVINRIYYGFVIDFIDLHINDWHFATFNIADLSIFIGILIFTKTNYRNH